MGRVRVISKQGVDSVQRNEQDAQTGEVEVMAAIREAECFFIHERARGAKAFRVAPSKPTERIDQFDLKAEQIILVPRVVGR